MQKGQIKVIKIDKDNHEVKLKGVKFDILDEKGNILETITTNEKGEAYTSRYAIRDCSKLTIREKETLKGYFADEETKTIELKENETIITSKLAKNFDLKEGNDFEYYGRDGRKNILKVKYIVPSLTSLAPVEIVTNEETYLKILDEDEYAVNKEKYGYGEEIEKILQSELESLKEYAKNGELVFNDKIINDGFNTFWNAFMRKDYDNN